MTNEILLLTTIIFDLAFVLLSLRFGKSGVICTVVVNVILVNVFGNKLISLFGFTTNSGNVFYASTFLAANILAEQFGKKDVTKAIWVGFLGFIMFVMIGQFTIRFIGDPLSETMNTALYTVFQAAPRIAFASIVAYICSQYTNAYVFLALKAKHGKKLLWLRNGISVLIAQVVDSLFFFIIAFFDKISIELLIQVMLFGFILKVIIGLISTPFLYLSYPVKIED